MTYVGKILVLLIMAMSLVFLGVSVTAFVTVTNWKEANAKTQAELKKTQGLLATRDAEKKHAEANLEKAQSEFAATSKKYEDQDRRPDDRPEHRQGRDHPAPDHPDRRPGQCRLGRRRVPGPDPGDDRAPRPAQRLDRLGQQAQDRADREERPDPHPPGASSTPRSARPRGSARTSPRPSGRSAALGGSIDLSRLPSVGGDIPSDVEGKVAKVDPKTGKSLEISIGSDDGVTWAWSCILFRTQPMAEYLGKVRITAVDPDQAVAVVIGNTVHGKKIKEGDNVSSTLRSK